MNEKESSSKPEKELARREAEKAEPVARSKFTFDDLNTKVKDMLQNAGDTLRDELKKTKEAAPDGEELRKQFGPLMDYLDKRLDQTAKKWHEELQRTKADSEGIRKNMMKVAFWTWVFTLALYAIQLLRIF